jgi:hypothetical protein
MKYQFGMSTTNVKEAAVFDLFKDEAKRELATHVEFLSHLMNLHYQWRETSASNSLYDLPVPKSRSLSSETSNHQELTRIAIAIENLTETTRELLNK